MNKQELPKVLRLFGAFLIALMLLGGWLSYWNAAGDRKAAPILDLPRLTTEAELRQAAAGTTQRYLLENLPLTGEPASDSFGILRDAYLCVEYRCERFAQEYDEEEGMTRFSWQRDSSRDRCAFSPCAYLAGEYPVALEECQLDYRLPIALDETTCLPEAYDKLQLEYYYPYGTEEREWDLRYTLYAVPQGAPATLLADAGEGQVTVAPVRDDLRVIACDGEVKDLLYYASENEIGVMALGGLAILMVAIVLLVLAIRALRRARKMGKEESVS